VRADEVENRNEATGDPRWLERFQTGDVWTLEQVYYQHFDTVYAEVGRRLSGADRETVLYDLFRRLLGDPLFRRGFRTGDLRGWLIGQARDLATAYARRGKRAAPAGRVKAALTEEHRRLMARFLRDVLPPAWRALFQTRFVARLSRAEAAAVLGEHPTTLAVRELRIRHRLRKFLLAA
jgi:hypothetical protein